MNSDTNRKYIPYSPRFQKEKEGKASFKRKQTEKSLKI